MKPISEDPPTSPLSFKSSSLSVQTSVPQGGYQKFKNAVFRDHNSLQGQNLVDKVFFNFCSSSKIQDSVDHTLKVSNFSKPESIFNIYSSFKEGDFHLMILIDSIQ